MTTPAPIIRPDWRTLSTEERRAIFEPLWLEGISASQIALHYFNYATRNAVLGAVHRAKLPAKPKPEPKKDKIIRQPMAVPAFVSRPPEPEITSQSVLDMIHTGRPPLAGTIPVSILALPSRAGVLCRFPVTWGGSQMYCGVECGEKVYCETHMAIAFKPTDKIRVPREARL